MSSDEAAIRHVFATWMQASKAGDVDVILSLMTDDVVFLLPGQLVMRKADFAMAARVIFWRVAANRRQQRYSGNSNLCRLGGYVIAVEASGNATR